MNTRRFSDGGLVDRSRELRFRFNGRALTGFAGDSLASALLANGVRVVGRSFKYHRPRGIYSAGEEEPCAFVETGEGARRVPNGRATTIPLVDGLVAASQSGWPTVDFDLGRLIDFSHGLWPAGFYNKTFKWPGWSFWEPWVRRSTGMGLPLSGPDPDRYERINVHCDLLVCGAGPAGLQVALVASRAGLRVILAEQDRRPGGSLGYETVRLDGEPAVRWVDRAWEELESLPNVVLLTRTVVSAIYDGNIVTLVQESACEGADASWRECLWTVRPRRIALATGAVEQGLIFPNNDRPGIMLASAVRQYLNRYAVRLAERAVVATNNDSAYRTAFDLLDRGIRLAAVADSRGDVDPQLRHRLADHGVELLTRARIADTRGAKGLREVRIESQRGAPLARVDCDLLAVSGGWSARAHLLAHARGSLRFDDASQSFLPDRLPQGIVVVGSAAGPGRLQEQLNSAADTARQLCDELGPSAGRRAGELSLPRVEPDPAEALRVGAMDLDLSKPRQWIDLAHDVTLGDAQLAVREGFRSVEHFKRYTTTGMSVDQGKTGNLNAFIVLGKLTGRETGAVGTTTFRPPYVPASLGAIAAGRRGERYAARRYLPAHEVHRRLGARFEDYGWQRPDAYPLGDESLEDAVRREVEAVRNAVGVYDNSPIGKLEVRGPDAAAFLERLYMNRVGSLRPGRARYGLMLNENAIIIDDGVFVRWAEDRFTVHSTSAGVTRVSGLMEEWLQCEWPDLRVVVDDLTTQWACYTLAGPQARELLRSLAPDLALEAGDLPHMAATTGRVAGVSLRIVRVSFSGEQSFEVSVPAGVGAAFLETLVEAGRPFGLVPYGIEALMRLRLEKGYLHVGTDTDGASTPDDVGWGTVARSKDSDYIGRRSLFREAAEDPARRQLVGLEAVDPGQAMRPGAHLLNGIDSRPPAPTQGWITSAGYSPTLGRCIALAMLSAGRSRHGETLTACDESHRYPVRVVSPVFYDPENQKLRG